MTPVLFELVEPAELDENVEHPTDLTDSKDKLYHRSSSPLTTGKQFTQIRTQLHLRLTNNTKGKHEK